MIASKKLVHAGCCTQGSLFEEQQTNDKINQLIIYIMVMQENNGNTGNKREENKGEGNGM